MTMLLTKSNNIFKPQKRKDLDEISTERDLINKLDFFKDIFNSLSTLSLVLNSSNQIIFASNDFLDLIDLSTQEKLIGYRPGEALGCVNVPENGEGCGTSDACQMCDAVKTVQECQQTGKKIQKEARLTTSTKNKIVAFDLKVTASPFQVEDKVFYIVSFEDISVQQQHKRLERTFYHDMVNIASSIKGITSLLRSSTDDSKKEMFAEKLNFASQMILDQIESQRQMVAAEKNELSINKIDFESSAFLSEIIKLMTERTEEELLIMMDEETENLSVNTDKSILGRIIINMLKNAIEANTDNSAPVVVGSTMLDSYLRFWVQSDKLIHPDFHSLIFQRSFSTKGPDRGLGTYSMKLLGENYLNGKVGFVSNQVVKTIFFIDIPLAS